MPDTVGMRVIAFDHKLTVAVPNEFRRALDAAARLRGLSCPDFICREMRAALVREHVPFDVGQHSHGVDVRETVPS